MISILSKTVFQCPFENILLLRQIQKQSPSHKLETSNASNEAHAGNGSSKKKGKNSFSFRYNSFSSLDDEEEANHLTLDDENDMIGSLDADGYLKADPKYANQFQLPEKFAHLSTWNAMVSLVWHKHEGIASLWKGYFSLLYRKTLFSITQPAIRKWLEGTLSHQDTYIPLYLSHTVAYRFICLIASHSITGILLSPLELIQSRMIAQTCKKGLRKYKSTYQAISTILREEYSSHHPQASFSMMLGIWLTPNLLIPSILQHGLEPLFEHITPVLTDRLLYSKKASSIAVVLLDFAISTVSLLIMTPIETVRKRLQCQAIITMPIEGSREYNTVVELGSTPLAYSSPLDCAWRIVMVEDGIRGLYRGFKAKLVYTFSVALLQLLTSINRLDGLD